jgi:hypothetical protein
VRLFPTTSHRKPRHQRVRAILVLAACCAVAGGLIWLLSARPRQVAHRSDCPTRLDARVRSALVLVDGGNCRGAVVENPSTVLTADHCLDASAQSTASVQVELCGGGERWGKPLFRDADNDLALLRLSRPAPVQPLELSAEHGRPGQLLYFAVPECATTRQVCVQRLGSCPTLPEVKDALFTSLQAREGDSGAPLVDCAGRVVGVVHGGARCHIATPVWRLVCRFRCSRKPCRCN